MPHILRRICSPRPERRPRRAPRSSATSPTFPRAKDGFTSPSSSISSVAPSSAGSSPFSLHTEVVTGALRRALDTGLIHPGALFHSDRGCQYSAALTRQLLARHGLRQSMSAAGYCYDNAFAESAFASLKSELLEDGAPFASKAAAATSVFDYLQTFYNRKRRHSSLSYQSPQDFLDRYFQNLNPSLN